MTESNGVSGTPASESTPLNGNATTGGYGSSDQGGLGNIRRDFEDAINEEEPGTLFYDILLKRPIAVLMALCLFALLALAVSSVRAIDTQELVNLARSITEIEPTGVELLDINDSKIVLETRADIVLDYTKLGQGWTYPIVTSLGRKLGFVDATLDGPVQIRTKDANSSEWDYLISLYCDDPVRIQLNLDSETPQSIKVKSYLSDVGRTNVIRGLVHRALKNEPLDMKAEGAVVVSKYGLNYKVGFTLTERIQIPPKMTDDFAQLAKVEVVQEHTDTAVIKALANATMDATPMINAHFPSFNWIIKIPGCTEDELEVACTGSNEEFDINSETSEIEVYVGSKIKGLPANIIDSCYHQNKAGLGSSMKENDDFNSIKSPLDRWISSYFIGRDTVFYVEGMPTDDQPQILNDLLTGYEIPYYVYEVNKYQKMIQNVSIEDVKFDTGNLFHPDDNTNGLLKNPLRAPFDGLPFDGVPKTPFSGGLLDGANGREMIFSGQARVDVVLPQFLDMTKARTAVVVKGIRGTIQMFKEYGGSDATRRAHFGQIIADEWIETFTFSTKKGYKIEAFFDKLPMDITDSEVFTRVSNEVLWNGHSEIVYDAVVDVDFEVLSESFITQKIHITGKTDMRAR